MGRVDTSGTKISKQGGRLDTSLHVEATASATAVALYSAISGGGSTVGSSTRSCGSHFTTLVTGTSTLFLCRFRTVRSRCRRLQDLPLDKQEQAFTPHLRPSTDHGVVDLTSKGCHVKNRSEPGGDVTTRPHFLHGVSQAPTRQQESALVTSPLISPHTRQRAPINLRLRDGGASTLIDLARCPSEAISDVPPPPSSYKRHSRQHLFWQNGILVWTRHA